MPYRKIHWIKLEKRLLNDHRFYTMSDLAQLLYIKLLLMAGETDNKIPKGANVLILALRLRQIEPEVLRCIEEIKTHFPRFKENSEVYYFEEFEDKHNWVFPKKSVEVPGEFPEKSSSSSYSYIYTYNTFNDVWCKYPNRVGKKEAFKHYQATVRTEEDFKNIQKALENYCNSDVVKKGFVQNGKTWFNNWQDWIVSPKTEPNWIELCKKKERK